jgi:hypothetical protein
MTEPARLIRVTNNRQRWCCGLVVHGGQVIAAAPLIGWAVGKPTGMVLSYLCRHGAVIEYV